MQLTWHLKTNNTFFQTPHPVMSRLSSRAMIRRTLLGYYALSAQRTVAVLGRDCCGSSFMRSQPLPPLTAILFIHPSFSHSDQRHALPPSSLQPQWLSSFQDLDAKLTEVTVLPTREEWVRFTILTNRGTQLELETKAIRRFAKVSIVSYSRPSLMIFVLASQYHVYLPWGQRPFSIVS